MILETIYQHSELETGQCKSCGEKTRVVRITVRCPECIEAQRAEELSYQLWESERPSGPYEFDE